MALNTLVLGVVVLGVATSASNQSPALLNPNEPTTSQESFGKRGVDTPEVVLQLKYDRGELNKIYLAQYRKGTTRWAPSVPERLNLCVDLCHSGLGGKACGPTCPKMLPVGLQTALTVEDTTETEVFGQPRYSVCPSLCENSLGDPLCNCTVAEGDETVEWNSICNAFCVDGYELGGCPSCSGESDKVSALSTDRILNTSAGWTAWCSAQCRLGHGGAACNCDRAPFQ